MRQGIIYATIAACAFTAGWFMRQEDIDAARQESPSLRNQLRIEQMRSKAWQDKWQQEFEQNNK